MQRYALTFRVKPGSQERVRQLLADYEPPQWRSDDGALLLGTSIFMKDDVVVRFVEVEGNIGRVMAHLSKQPSIQKLERDLDEHLLEPRDMSTPQSARAFFERAMMEHVTTRTADAGALAG